MNKTTKSDLQLIAQANNIEKIAQVLSKRAITGPVPDELIKIADFDWKNLVSPDWYKGLAQEHIVNPIASRISDDAIKGTQDFFKKPWVGHALMGAGLGGAVGLGSGLIGRKRKSKALTDMLYGGLLGGGAGVGLGLVSEHIAKNIDPNSPTHKIEKANKDLQEAQAAGSSLGREADEISKNPAKTTGEAFTRRPGAIVTNAISPKGIGLSTAEAAPFVGTQAYNPFNKNVLSDTLSTGKDTATTIGDFAKDLATGEGFTNPAQNPLNKFNPATRGALGGVSALGLTDMFLRNQNKMTGLMGEEYLKTLPPEKIQAARTYIDNIKAKFGDRVPSEEELAQAINPGRGWHGRGRPGFFRKTITTPQGNSVPIGSRSSHLKEVLFGRTGDPALASSVNGLRATAGARTGWVGGIGSPVQRIGWIRGVLGNRALAYPLAAGAGRLAGSLSSPEHMDQISLKRIQEQIAENAEVQRIKQEALDEAKRQ